MRNIPNVRICVEDPRDQQRLSQAVHTQKRGGRLFNDFVGDLGERKSLEALASLGIAREISRAPVGQRGHDIVIGGHSGSGDILIQVKTSSFLDEVQGIFKNFEFDIAIIVDLGITIADRPAKYAPSPSFPYQSHIDFYVLRPEDVRENVVSNRGGMFIYGLKDPAQSERRRMKHFRGLPTHRNRWDVVLDLL